MCDGVIEYSVSVSTNIYSNSTHPVKKSGIGASLLTLLPLSWLSYEYLRPPITVRHLIFWRARLRRLFMGFAVFFLLMVRKKYLLFKTSSACQPRCLGGLRVKDDEAIYRTVSPIRISPVKQAVMKIGTQGNRVFFFFFFFL